MYEYGHEQVKLRKKRWNDKADLLNRNNVNGKLKREGGGYSVPGARTWISNVICRGLFFCERWLLVLLILVELMSITVWTFFSCNDYIRLHFDFTNIYWFAYLSSGERIHCFSGKRYNDACFKDRKSLQRIRHICAHTQIFRRAGCLIVACGDV